MRQALFVCSGVALFVTAALAQARPGTAAVKGLNLSEKRLFLGLSTENLRVVERFTRSTADALDYRFTVDDPTRWTKPWTAVVPIEKTDGLLYEFACHEGNYGLRNILSVARAQEKVSAEAAK